MNRLNNIDLKVLPECFQSFDDMETIDGCKTCAQCNKTIHDLRDKSLQEISFIHASSLEPICAIYSDQLLKPSNYFSKPKALVNAVGLSLLGLVTAPTSSVGQTKELIELNDTVNPTTTNSYTNDSIPIIEIPSIKGYVLDSLSNKGVLAANVVIQYTELGTTTDWDGKFELSLLDIDSLPEEINLVVSYLGYNSRIVELQKSKIISDSYPKITCLLTQGVELIAFSVVQRKTPWYKKLWAKIKRIF